MTKVTVLGGTGFLGQRTVAALRTVAGLEVEVASRRGPRRVDVTRPETFAALEGSRLVIDLTDATSVRPDEVIAWCLDRGLTVIEATSDAPCVERLHRAHAGRSTGLLVLGGGIFTGVSNLLGAHAALLAGGVTRLQLGIASSPFSGAGAGTIALMVSSLALPSVRYQAGQRLELPGVGEGPRLDFDVQRPTVRVCLAEPFMLRHSTGAADVDVFFSPKPALLVPAFRLLPAWLLRSRLFLGALRAWFTVLRRGLLRSRVSPVELVAFAEGPAGAVTARVNAADGMAAGAWALAAIAEQALRADATGVRFVDQVTTLEQTVARANALAGAAVLQLT